MKIRGIPSTFLTDLMWIDLQHNNLVKLPKEEFERIPNLKSLYLHRNYIFDLKELENLNHLTQLMSLTIHGNPVDRIPHFRYFLLTRLIILSILPTLKKLDTVLYSKKERDNAQYVPKMIATKDFMKCKPTDMVHPPEREVTKNPKDDASFS